MSGEFTRRRLLEGAGAVGAASLFGTQVTAALGRGQTDRHVVGVERGYAGAARQGADKVYRELDFGQLGQAVAGRFSDAALEALRNNPNVRYVEVDGRMEAIGQTLPWGVDRVDADVAHANGETGGDGSGADISIIDTGIDSDHPDLQANLGEGVAYVEANGSYDEPWDDDNDHGTHCAGIADALENTEGVVGVSTAATLHAVKVLDDNGSGSYSDVAAGIEWTADQGYDVGSLSLGGSKSQVVADAVQYAYSNGVLLVAAAGNSGPCSDCVGYPAAEPEVIAVSATSEDDSLASFSSTGPEVELAAPGERIYSTVVGSYDTLSGTSMACPHVGGAAGQLMDDGYANTEARDQLNSTAEDIGLGDNEQGNGLLDVEAGLGLGGIGVDSLAASEVETADGDARFDVEWSVSDSDGNLETVDLVLEDTTASETEDSATVNVSGDTASGTTRLVAAGDDGSGNSYEVTATVADADGNTDSETVAVSESEAAPTVDSLSLSEAETSDSDAEFDAAWTVSDVDADLDAVDLTLTDGTDGETEDTASVSVSGDTASGTTRLVAAGDDGSGNSYTVEAVVTDTDGTSSSDTASATESDDDGSGGGDDSVPTIDQFELVDKSNPQWARVEVDWTVADADGDLADVTTTADFANGGTDSASTSVAGGTATGTHKHRERKAHGDVDVTLTVTDGAGNQTSETRTVTLN